MAITTLNNRSINRSDTAASGQLWTATSATASDFQAAAAGGKIGQVLQATTTNTATYGTQTFADITGLTIDITPAATSSKILIMTDVLLSLTTGYGCCIRMMRDSTAIYLGTAASSRPASTKSTVSPNSTIPFSLNAMYLDAPSTTSATTYKIQWLTETASAIYRGRSVNDGDDAFRGRTADSITVMEVLA